MKTLSIAICLLLVFLPAGAQETSPHRTPNFYVPYGVRDIAVDAIEWESSSAEMSIAHAGQRRDAPPTPRRYPTHRRGYRRNRAGYGANPQPPEFSTGAMIAGLVAVGVAIAVVAAGDH